MKRLVVLWLVSGFSTALQAGSSTVNICINEFMASNLYTQLDPEYTDFPDWIELYNAGEEPRHLGGIFITDDFDNPLKWPLPADAVLQSKSFFIIWADGSGHDNHADFKLAESGGEIGLFMQDGTALDAVTYDEQLDDISYGRCPDGGANGYFFPQPTFNGANASIGTKSPHRTTTPSFSSTGGFYTQGLDLTITADPDASIHYTLDGSIPSLLSPQYSQLLRIDATTVVRARAFVQNFIPSKTETQTFIIHEPTTLPVICIATPSEFLFDQKIGITVGTPVADDLGAPPPFDPNANFWKDWERPVYIEYYENDGDCGFAQQAGIKIFGGYFGRQIRQKAFTLFARDKYNNPDFDYPLFPAKNIESFSRFLLRCSSNDFNRTFIRDAMMNTLVMGQMDVDAQAYQPAVVYINGAYWGLYNIREKINQFYPESNYGIDADDIDLIQAIDGVNTAVHGDGAHYMNLVDYVKSHDLAVPSHYEYVQSQMDVDEFMNYFMTQLYIRNHDWLHQNIKCWRQHSTNGRWRWLLYDLDWGFSGEIMQGDEQYKTNSLQWALSQGEVSILFQRLLENQEFKQEFAQRFATHLNITFHPMRVHRIIDQLVNGIAAEMPRHIERWGAIPSLTYWRDQLQILHEFADRRPLYVFQHLEESFGLKRTELTTLVSDSSAGYILVHNVRCPAPVSTGSWFRGIPLRLQACAYPGWRFVRWEGTITSESASLVIELDDPTTMHAVFEPDFTPVIVISEIHYHPSAELQGDDELYEFVELKNLGQGTVDLSGYRFSKGFAFTFPEKSAIAKNEFIITAKTAATYAGRGFQVFQISSGSLANEGESLCLLNSQSEVVDSLTYNDQYPWPVSPDGEGASLELTDFSADNSLAAAWDASKHSGGTPGAAPQTAVDESRRQMTHYRLFPVLPNPFNTQTMITFELAQPTTTQIHIVNLLGKKVDSLDLGFINSGRHSVTWNAAEHASGIYFVMLSTADFQQTTKCLLLK